MNNKNTEIIIPHVIVITLLVYIIISLTIGSILHPPMRHTSSTRRWRDEVVRAMIVVIRSRPASLLNLLYVVQRLVRADLGGHLKYSRRWSGVRAGVLLGAQGAVHRGENRGGL